jgi:hypothetical protein
LRKTRRRLALIAVLLLESARRPVVVRSVAAARAVERGDVLQRHEDVAVQLDVGDVLDVAVRGEDTLLVLPSEEGDLDLLALVFVRVVLDARSVANALSARLDATRRGPLNGGGRAETSQVVTGLDLP